MGKDPPSILIRSSILFDQRAVGFTLLELIMVIAILGTLAGIAVPVYIDQIEKAKITRAIVEIRMIDKEINMFRLEKKALPNTLDDVGYQNLRDPWGNPYQFTNHADVPKGQWRKYKKTVPLNSDYDLYSMGPNGVTKVPITTKEGYDDIVRANNGGYVGPAAEF